MLYGPDGYTKVTSEWSPPAPPKGWALREERADAAAYTNQARKLAVILSMAIESDNRRWVHFSISHRTRLPTWGEFRDCKELFLGADVYAYQIVPPRDRYVNIHPRVLHLFVCLDGPRLPEFSFMDGKQRYL